MEKQKDKENEITVMESNISVGTLLLAIASVFLIIKAIKRRRTK